MPGSKSIFAAIRKTSYFFDHNICLYYTNKRILFLSPDAVIFSSESTK